MKITAQVVKDLIPKRKYDDNKGSVGSLFTLTGSYGMAGATILSGKGALYSGTGLLKIAMVNSIYPVVTSAIPEAVCFPMNETEGAYSSDNIQQILSVANSSNALVVGCGMTVNQHILKIIKYLLRENNTTMILDADGLNCVSKDINIIDKKKCPLIITPHPKEFSRLSGLSVEHIQNNREEVCQSFSKKHNVITVLKGYETVISDGYNVFLNTTGNPGMAKGGSGDVLSGVIGSLCSQGLSPLNASLLGVFIHGYAGDLATEKYGELSMTPSHMISLLPKAFMDLSK